MAKRTVSGWTQEEIDELREEWDKDKAFDEAYCLAKIPHQPEDYTGPDRFCMNREVYEIGDNYICPYHGGKGETNIENLDKLAAMKHGMEATRTHLVKDFDEKDWALYNWITSTWPSAYDIDLESDPQAAYDFHRLAAEIVRAERGRGYLIREGEVQETEKVSDEGNLVIDENGEVVTEKSQHYLADMMNQQDNKINKLEKQLGITRKERERQKSTDNAVEAIKDFAEIGSSFISRDEKDYDPDDEPWKNDNDS